MPDRVLHARVSICGVAHAQQPNANLPGLVILMSPEPFESILEGPINALERKGTARATQNSRSDQSRVRIVRLLACNGVVREHSEREILS